MEDLFDLIPLCVSGVTQPLLVIRTFVSFSNRTPPSPGFLTSVFDELFEVLKIIFDPSGNDSDSITDILDKSLGVVGNL